MCQLYVHTINCMRFFEASIMQPLTSVITVYLIGQAIQQVSLVSLLWLEKPQKLLCLNSHAGPQHNFFGAHIWRDEKNFPVTPVFSSAQCLLLNIFWQQIETKKFCPGYRRVLFYFYCIAHLHHHWCVTRNSPNKCSSFNQTQWFPMQHQPVVRLQK